jgi:hypothetical protein
VKEVGLPLPAQPLPRTADWTRLGEEPLQAVVGV